MKSFNYELYKNKDLSSLRSIIKDSYDTYKYRGNETYLNRAKRLYSLYKRKGGKLSFAKITNTGK